MTQKQAENKVFLSRLRTRTRGTEHLFLQGRGRCLVDESVLNKPVHERPVCSVIRLIAKYLSMPAQYDNPVVSPALATPDAKKKLSRALVERFAIRSKVFDERLVSRDVLVYSFVANMENMFYHSGPRHVLEKIFSDRSGIVLRYLNSGRDFKGYAFKGEGLFDDVRNLIRPILTEERVLCVGGSIRLTVHAMRMLRESIALDLLLSTIRGHPSACDLIVMADYFAQDKLANGVISCRQCKQGKELAIPGNTGGGSIFSWRNREVIFNLEAASAPLPDPLTVCPTGGMKPRYELDDDGINAGVVIPHSGSRDTFDNLPVHVPTAKERAAVSDAIRLLANVTRPDEPRDNWPVEDPNWANGAPWDKIPEKKGKKR